MIEALNLIESNVGMWEHILLIIVVLGGFIFYAKDFKIGVILHFACTGALFMYFYQQGLYFISTLVVFFIFLVIMTLSLYASMKVSKSGGLV